MRDSIKRSRVSKKVFVTILSITALMLQGPLLQAQEIDLENGLILYLPIKGNALDESVNKVPTMLDRPFLTKDRYGNPDQAYDFDGINDQIILNQNQALITSNQFTICMWAKIEGRSKAEPTYNNPLFEQRNDAPGASVEITFQAERLGKTYLALRSSAGTQTEILQADYPGDLKWYHFAAMLDENKTIYLFINGELKATSTLVGGGDFYSGVNRVGIGAMHVESLINGAFYGAIDEVFIYNRALKLCEIETLYSEQLLYER